MAPQPNRESHQRDSVGWSRCQLTPDTYFARSRRLEFSFLYRTSFRETNQLRKPCEIEMVDRDAERIAQARKRRSIEHYLFIAFERRFRNEDELSFNLFTSREKILTGQ